MRLLSQPDRGALPRRGDTTGAGDPGYGIRFLTTRAPKIHGYDIDRIITRELQEVLHEQEAYVM